MHATMTDKDSGLTCSVGYNAIENRLTFSFNGGPSRPVDPELESRARSLTDMTRYYLGHFADFEPYQASKSILL